MAFTGDMLQQNSNGSYLKQTARYGCHFCFIHKDSLGDLEFDMSAKGYYHYEIKNNQKEAMMMMQSDAYSWLAGMGILPEPLVLQLILPTLNFSGQNTPVDAPHSDWQGLGCTLQDCIFYGLLTKVSREGYNDAFHSFLLPHGWPSLQSPISYHRSWIISESSCVTVIIVYVLWKFLKDEYINNDILFTIQMNFTETLR